MILRMQYSGYSKKDEKEGRKRGRKTVTLTQGVEKRRTRERKDEKGKRLVQVGRKRGGNLCTSYTEFTATEEISERNKTTGFQD